MKLGKAFAKGLSTDIKFSKTQLSKMIQSGEIVGELLVGIPYAVLYAIKGALKNT